MCHNPHILVKRKMKKNSTGKPRETPVFMRLFWLSLQKLASPMPSPFLALGQRDPHEDTSAKYSSSSEGDGGMVVGTARAERFIKYT